MDKKTFCEGVAVGGVAGAIAGAIVGIMLARKSGQETREAIKANLLGIKDKAAERLGAVEDLTRSKYEEAIKAVIAEYSAAKRITADQANELEAGLRDAYETIRQTIHEHTAAGEPPPTA